jgi:hypothetical protein
MFQSVVRDASWLTAERALAFARIVLIAWLLLLVLAPWMAPAMPIGRDFGAFWSAARLALAGEAASAYGPASPAALTALFGPARYPPFFYPPVALLLWLPFALAPFAVAAGAWLVATGAAYIGLVGGLLKGRSRAFVAAFPAVLVCVLYGQNSLLSAALLAGAALTLGSRPGVAGVCLGCLAFKPQLAVLVPLALAVAGRWRAVLAAAGTVVGLGGLSVAVFGVETWVAFLRALPEASAWTTGGVPGFDRFSSPYAAARLMGATSAGAWLVQGVGMAVATAALILVNRRRPGGAAEIAMVGVATALCVPMVGEYDLVILSVPGAWLVAEALRTGWRPYEKLLLALLYLAPLPIKIAALMLRLPLAPLMVVVLAILVARRAWGLGSGREDLSAERLGCTGPP